MDILRSGDSANRVDIVFVAEGYTASEMQRFYADAQRLADSMFEQTRLNSPFGEYQQYFNVKALFTPSNQSGYSTTSRTIDTAFDARATLSDGRGIIGNGNLVRRFVNRNTSIDEQDIIVVLVNTSDYGGAASGNVAWVTARNSKSVDVLLHEIGHSFAGLDDEYVDPEVAAVTPLTSTTLANSVHLSTSTTNVPWAAWLGFRDSLGVVGIYEGGYYRSSGVYRATLTSKMRDFGQPFSAPQKEAIVHAIYETVGGAVSLQTLTPYVYQAQVIDPEMVVVNWRDSRGVKHDFGLDPMTTFGSSAFSYTVTPTELGGFVRTGLEKINRPITIGTAPREALIYSPEIELDLLAAQVIRFSDGNDRAHLNTLNGSFLDFGAGNDALLLGFGHREIQLQTLSDSVWLLSRELGGQTSYLATAGLERLVFADQRAWALDDEVVGQAYRLYQAVFARKPDDIGLGYWVDVLDRGASLSEVAFGFSQSAEFLTSYGRNPSNESFVSTLYQNVLGRVQDAAGAAFWVDHLEAGRLEPHEVLASFSESEENYARLEPVLGQGVWFTSWLG